MIASKGFSQKTMEKIWGNAEITTIEIVSDEVSLVTISSNKSDTIKLKTKVEGENYEYIMLEVLKKDHLLAIRPIFTPFFEANNDKLAAHKVVAIEMELEIPEKTAIFIGSSLASVKTQGIFNQIHLELRNGNCELLDFQGNATLATRNGSIAVIAQENVSAKAQSKRGKVKNNLFKAAKYFIEAKSINGDISLQKKQ